jgi:hypothetical protein
MLRHFDEVHAERANHEEDTGNNHHGALMRAYQAEDETARKSSYNLRNADGAVEEAQISAHVAIALQGIGDKRERHGEHGSPAGTYHEERDELQELIMDERYHRKSDAADDKADSISQLRALELRQDDCPYHAAHCLNGKEDAHPVASLLKGFRGRNGGVPYGLSDGAGGIVPHIEETSPAEELHQPYFPKRGGSFLQQRYPVATAFLFALLGFLHRGDSVICGVFLWIPLLYLSMTV